MDYVAFIGTGGPMPQEAVAEMNRDLPAYAEEMAARGVRRGGRELDFPDTAATVRVRDEQPLVTDGPFAETKEFVGGFDLLVCDDLDEAIEVQSRNPVTRFLPFELRPFAGPLRLGSAAAAFEARDDSAGVPYLLSVWAPADDADMTEEEVVAYGVWQDDLDARGAYVLGERLGGPQTATTVRQHDGEIDLADGPFLRLPDAIVGLDVVTCVDRQQALDTAARHPLAARHTIEVRPFYSEAVATPPDVSPA